MPRTIYNKSIGKGIEFFEIRDTTMEWNRSHVMRVDINKAMPFYIGSLALEPVIFKRGIPYIEKTTLHQFAKRANRKIGKTSLDYSILGKKVMHMWISNGTFFGDDCYEYNDQGDAIAQISHSYMTGAIVSKGRAIASSPNLHDKSKRSLLLQRFRPNQIDFRRQNSYLSASDLVAEGWSSAIGGGGALVEGGNFRGLPLHRNRPSDWWWQRPHGMFSNGQTYCAGPVIAINNNATCLYLIQDRTHTNNLDPSKPKNFYNLGRRWEHMSSYLRYNFLSEINRTRDGSIEEAVVYDGGGSRGLWVRDYVDPRGSRQDIRGLVAGYYGLRPIPQYICLWGQAG